MAVPCTACRTENPEGSAYCHACGTPIVALPPGPPSTSPQMVQRDLRRTKMGLYLLALAFLLAWLPAVGLVGLLFLAPGGFLVLAGRRAFGERHTSRAIWSLVTFVLAVLGTLSLLLVLAATLATSRPSVDLASVRTTLASFLWGNVVATGLYAVSAVLLLSDLMPAGGKILLFLALGLAVAGSAVAAIDGQALLGTEFVGQAPSDQLGALVADLMAALPIVYAFPGALAFAAACVLPTVLVARGELPRVETAPRMGSPPFTDLPPRA